MKKIWKSIKIWQSYGREFSGLLFWPTLYSWLIYVYLIETDFNQVQMQKVGDILKREKQTYSHTRYIEKHRKLFKYI